MKRLNILLSDDAVTKLDKLLKQSNLKSRGAVIDVLIMNCEKIKISVNRS